MCKWRKQALGLYFEKNKSPTFCLRQIDGERSSTWQKMNRMGASMREH